MKLNADTDVEGSGLIAWNSLADWNRLLSGMSFVWFSCDLARIFLPKEHLRMERCDPYDKDMVI